MWTIHEAADSIRARKLSPIDLLEQCLARVDQLEARVRAWVFVARDEAREQARQLTAELDRGQYRGALHGIPIGVKDIIDVFDWPTACGSRLWANSIARRDATVVERLRQAGAVLMGKTVTTAYASFDPPPTRNPWNLERTPGGSSSGSAAAVACGMCLGALASQTGGSITRPAAFCGVASIKPTYGRVSVDRVMPLAPTMDHIGAMANSVRDLAILFQAIAGPDARDPDAAQLPVPDCVGPIDRTLSPTADGLDKPLVHFKGMFDDMADPVTRDLFARALKAIPGTETAVPPAGFCEVLKWHQTVMAVEAAEYHTPRLKRHPDDYPPKIRALIEEGQAASALDYRRARTFRDQLEEQMEALRDWDQILVTPAALGPAPVAATTGNPAFNSPWSFTGLPTVSIPFAWSPDGLPVSMQFIGTRWTEAQLLATAAWCERQLAFPKRSVELP